MPLPLLIAGAVAAAAWGAKKGYDAYQDTQEAEGYHSRAKNLYEKGESDLNSARNRLEKSFETLGKLQANIVDNELKQYAELIDKLEVENDIDLENIIGKDTMGKLVEVRDCIVSLETTLGAVVGSAAAGAVAGFGAFGGAGLLACASTGTAISSLSGVAATNATLAWFGGGSLAAGGLGMAGGTLVLGGIVAGPVLAVMGSVFAAKAEEKKYDAEAYYDSIKALCESMEAEALTHKEIFVKSVEKIEILNTYRGEMLKMLISTENIMHDNGTSVSSWNEREQSDLKALMQLAEVTVTTINAPIMNDEDELTKQLKEHQEKCKELMDDIQRKWGD